MDTFAFVAMSTPSIVLRYAAAFFFVLVAIAAAYALFKAGKVLDRVDVVLADVDKEAMPLLQKAGTTLDEVNGSLGNVDLITKDVASTTERLDKMANAVEGAVSAPARKAAAFSAGVQSAVSSFMKREGKDAGRAQQPAGAAWSYEPAGADAGAEPAAADVADTAAGYAGAEPAAEAVVAAQTATDAVAPDTSAVADTPAVDIPAAADTRAADAAAAADTLADASSEG